MRDIELLFLHDELQFEIIIDGINMGKLDDFNRGLLSKEENNSINTFFINMSERCNIVLDGHGNN